MTPYPYVCVRPCVRWSGIGYTTILRRKIQLSRIIRRANKSLVLGRNKNMVNRENRQWSINRWRACQSPPHELSSFLHIMSLPKPKQTYLDFLTKATDFQFRQKEAWSCYQRYLSWSRETEMKKRKSKGFHESDQLGFGENEKGRRSIR